MNNIIRNALLAFFCLFSQGAMGMEHIYDDQKVRNNPYAVQNYGSITQMQQSHSLEEGDFPSWSRAPELLKSIFKCKLPRETWKEIWKYLKDKDKLALGRTLNGYNQNINHPLQLKCAEIKLMHALSEEPKHKNSAYKYFSYDEVYGEKNGKNRTEINLIYKWTHRICHVRDTSPIPQLINKANTIITENQEAAFQSISTYGNLLKKSRHYVKTEDYQKYKYLDEIYNKNPESCLFVTECFAEIKDSCCYWNDACSNCDDFWCNKCCCDNIYCGPEGCFRPSMVSKTCYHMWGCPDIKYVLLSSVLWPLCCPCMCGACLFVNAIANGGE